MSASPERVKMNRRKRTEKFLNLLSRVIGYAALVALVSAIFYVVIDRMTQASKVDQAYLESVYDEEVSRGGNWSGIKESQPALLAPRGKAAAPKERVVASATTESKSDAEKRGHERVAVGLPKGDPVSGIGNLEEKRPLIEETLRKFFAANSVGEKLAFVRDPSRVRPLMNEFYNRKPMPVTKWQSLGWTLPVDEPGYRLGYVQANFEDGTPCSLIVEEMENGGFVVDWESYVRYSELNWQDFLLIRPVQPKLFRVIASKSGSDSTSELGVGQEMIEIKHPAEDGVVYATLDKNDPDLAPMVKQLQQGKWKDVPLTLRLCYPGTASDGKAVRIAGVEGKGWLILQPTRS